MRIFLIRHGESINNTGQNYKKRLPDHLVSLTENGIKQAQKGGIWLKNFCIENNIDISKSNTRIWRSPYLRTRQTVDEFNKSLKIGDIKEDITLAEQQFGLFDAMSKNEWKEKFPIEFEEYQRQRKNNGKFYARLPMGESPFDVAIRIHQFMGTIQRDYDKYGIDTLFIFTHGTVLRCFLMRWFHYTPEWYQDEKNPKNCWIRYIDEDENKKTRDNGYIYSK